MLPLAAWQPSPGSLLRAISEAGTLDFLKDWDADRAGRDDEPRPKGIPMSQLERDIEDYRIRLRMKDRA